MTESSAKDGGAGKPAGGRCAWLRWILVWALPPALAAGWGVALACQSHWQQSWGIEYAQWFVSQRLWFHVLLGAVAASLTASTFAARPWKWSRPAWALIPLGAAVAVGGFLYTALAGIEGRMMLWKGVSASAVQLVHRSRLVFSRAHESAAKNTPLAPTVFEPWREFSFRPGAVDWSGDAPLAFDEVDGLNVRVLGFLRHARYVPEFVPDESPSAPAAVRVSAIFPNRPRVDRWCLSNVLGSSAPAGQFDVTIQTTTVASLRDDFLKPPAMKPGTLGILSAHYKDRVFPIAVDGNKGKKVPLGDTGAAVEIVDYLPDSQSRPTGSVSRSAEPKNPMLKLQVHLPGQAQPIPSFAYSNFPFVTPESMQRPGSPVRLWYHHPSAAVFPGVEFLQTPDGKLCARVGVGKAYQPHPEVKTGDRFQLESGREVALLAHLPRAKVQGHFEATEAEPGEPAGDDAAAEVEVARGGKTEQFWLGRNDPRFGAWRTQPAPTPLEVKFLSDKASLGFTVKLAEITRDAAADRDDAYECQLLFTGADQGQVGASEDIPARTLATGESLHYGDYAFRVLAVQRMLGGRDLLILRVTSNPGRWLQYVGVGMCVVGLALGLLRRRPAL